MVICMQTGMSVSPRWPAACGGTTGELIKNADSQPHSEDPALESSPQLLNNTLQRIQCWVPQGLFFIGHPLPGQAHSSHGSSYHLVPRIPCLYTSLLSESYTSLTQFSVLPTWLSPRLVQLSVPKAGLSIFATQTSPVSPLQKVAPPSVQVHHSCLLFLLHLFSCLCMETSLSLLSTPLLCHFYSSDASICFSRHSTCLPSCFTSLPSYFTHL